VVTVCRRVVQRVTAIRTELSPLRRVIPTEDSVSVWTESMVVAVITACLDTTTSHRQDACVRTELKLIRRLILMTTAKVVWR